MSWWWRVKSKAWATRRFVRSVNLDGEYEKSPTEFAVYLTLTLKLLIVCVTPLIVTVTVTP